MKYRIVERKHEDGRLYYMIQCGFWNIWWNYSIIHLNSLYSDDMKLERVQYQFSTIEEAEKALKRSKTIRKYKGICLYPTIYNDWYYLKDWVVIKKSYRGRDQYQYIHGNYKYCCNEIDKHLKDTEIKQNNKNYKRIIPINLK